MLDAKFEVTPEMVEAGAEVIWDSFSDVLVRGSETGREVATHVYRAMDNHLRTLVQNEGAQRSRPNEICDRDTI
jgi:hypothetical protein